MENRELDVERFVAEHLAALEGPANWQPNAASARVRVREFDRRMKKRGRARLLATGAAAAVCIAAVLIGAPAAYCAGKSCSEGSSAAPQHAAKSPARPASDSFYKRSGAANAPVTIEIFSDLQCPHCATANQNLVPLLVTNYVLTGKVLLIHRDLPLASHRFAQLAARYANAAGRIGLYDAAVARIFATQALWSATGDIDGELAQALMPAQMEKIRGLVQTDRTLDDEIAGDVELARQYGVGGTPAVVVTRNGRRQVIFPPPSYELLKRYLDATE
jgi:protein-disulfide isomerase